MIDRSRGYLPHLESSESTYFVTFRLAGTLPQKVLHEIQMERKTKLEAIQKKKIRLSQQEEQHLKYLESKRIQDYLDNGIGECWLREKAIAEVVKNSIEYFDGTRYTSHAFCIMPNHAHWIVTPIRGDKVGKNDSLVIPIMHSIKSFTASQANKILNRTGAFWSREYYDHQVRDSEQFGRILIYILENPVKAGLCKSWRQWPWTKCSDAISESLNSEREAGWKPAV